MDASPLAPSHSPQVWPDMPSTAIGGTMLAARSPLVAAMPLPA
jgi:hypothetical protein